MGTAREIVFEVEFEKGLQRLGFSTTVPFPVRLAGFFSKTLHEHGLIVDRIEVDDVQVIAAPIPMPTTGDLPLYHVEMPAARSRLRIEGNLAHALEDVAIARVTVQPVAEEVAAPPEESLTPNDPHDTEPSPAENPPQQNEEAIMATNGTDENIGDDKIFLRKVCANAVSGLMAHAAINNYSETHVAERAWKVAHETLRLEKQAHDEAQVRAQNARPAQGGVPGYPGYGR